MSLYIDSSALLKRYVDEPDSDAANALLASDPSLLTARHTIVEVRRNLARLLDERDATPGGAAVPFVTFDVRQAQAARTLGLAVLPG